MAEFGLAFYDFGENGFIVFGCWVAGGFVFAILFLGHDEGEGHACFAGAACTADTVGVGFGCCGEIEV